MRTLYLNLPWRDAIWELRKFIPAESLIDAINAGLLPKRKVPSVDGPALAWSDVENAFRDRASQLYVEQRYPLKIAVEPRSLDDLLTLRPPGYPIKIAIKPTSLDELSRWRQAPVVAAVEERLLDLIYADDQRRRRGTRGTKPTIRDRVVKKMKDDIKANRLTVDGLRDFKQEALAERYGVNRETACKAREIVLSEFRTPTNSDTK
jgi:hypothetical protein